MKKFNYKLFINGELEKEIKTNDINYIKRWRNKEFWDESGAICQRYYPTKFNKIEEEINGKEVYYYGL